MKTKKRKKQIVRSNPMSQPSKRLAIDKKRKRKDQKGRTGSILSLYLSVDDQGTFSPSHLDLVGRGQKKGMEGQVIRIRDEFVLKRSRILLVPLSPFIVRRTFYQNIFLVHFQTIFLILFDHVGLIRKINFRSNLNVAMNVICSLL